jgi:hypothetical protein
MQWLKLTLVFAIAASAVYSQTPGTPVKMTRLVAQMSGAEIPVDSFAAKPKVYWRATNQYCRVDEEPDPLNRIHGRLIMNEPDAWLVNLADGTAKHFVDPGPTFNCKMPIFAIDPETAKSKVGELEFGREIEFFQSNGAKPIDGPPMSFKANFYELTIGDSALRLVERADVHAPIMIALERGQNVLEVRYQSWDNQLPFDPDVFAKPTGVKIEEPK